MIKRQIIEYYSKKCKLRPPSPPPHPTDTKKKHKKPQQQQNNQQKQKKKSPKQKKITPKRSFEFKSLRNHDCSIYEIISRYIEVPWLSLLPPQLPPPLPFPGISVDNRQLQCGYLLQWHTIIQCLEFGISKTLDCDSTQEKKLVKTSEDLMWVCNIFFHSYYVTGETVLMI